jgi:hypothetical protein
VVLPLHKVSQRCRLRRLNHAALTQLSIDVAAITDALARLPLDAHAAARGGPPPVRHRPPLPCSCCSAAQAGYMFAINSGMSRQTQDLGGAHVHTSRLNVAHAQEGVAQLAREHRAAVEERTAPVATLLKVLQIADDRAFVMSYQQLLQQRYQSDAQLAAVLAIVDIPKDAFTARVNLFRYRGGGTPRALAADGGGEWHVSTTVANPLNSNVRPGTHPLLAAGVRQR